ncbi:hypothetical protein FA13DRAFT_1785805 [Coprinellus micaceus]|uniref:Uncharacterized protein n=1 Tax=Coprinellus micaceus TaxID=71717 RepID=A0A4Y7TWJ6_COPMI|nr:hypothetical protein FA13DRAFT_1785805 [Coprinellus micaceus]
MSVTNIPDQQQPIDVDALPEEHEPFEPVVPHVLANAYRAILTSHEVQVGHKLDVFLGSVRLQDFGNDICALLETRSSSARRTPCSQPVKGFRRTSSYPESDSAAALHPGLVAGEPRAADLRAECLELRELALWLLDLDTVTEFFMERVGDRGQAVTATRAFFRGHPEPPGCS